VNKPLLIILGSALATGAVIKAAPALAEPNQAVSIVRTADLDLSTDAGRKALDHRLVTAAFEVCGTASDVDLAGKNLVRQCRFSVLAKARESSGQLASRDKGIILMAASH
jgi:UrcA family protein